MTFQDSLIVRNLFLLSLYQLYNTLYFSFLQAFSLIFLNVADFCNHIKKKIEYDYQKMTLYYLKEYKGVFNERIRYHCYRWR